MDGSGGGSGFAGGDPYARKKRSSISRRPHTDSQSLFQHHNIMLPSTTKPSLSGNNECCNDGIVGEIKLKKLKLKVGGVTHTIHTSYAPGYASEARPSMNNFSHNTDEPQRLPFSEGNGESDRVGPTASGKGSGENIFRVGKFSKGSSRGVGVLCNETGSNEKIRKSKRVPKRRVLDIGFGDVEDEDEEIRYLEKLNSTKVVADNEHEEDETNDRKWKTLKITTGNRINDCQSRSDEVYVDQDYTEDEMLVSDNQNESIPTTRNRALMSRKIVLSNSIQFQHALPLAPPKSQVEQQLKKAEAAQKRKMQSEKAAREAEAEVIKKILGQDSARKKKEEKKRQRYELAQASKVYTVGSNTVRWINGPNGTIIIFSNDIGLPSIFNSMPCSYPPPREKCAGPSCTNAYKYRDSKSNLPLCSLHCYKAIHEKMQPLIPC